ncbi:hypothetical protein MCAP1_001066 [Malassezia caprae]|uniref:Conserved oligomeric Golgi complex subunit 8 n=1 Tax=Malassezia caprae TaxID=1381934 RepID=A0AAF0E617_9BASI|nr:hypothetical protein MCAP1_001066 [Malassezia caprae]
MEASAADPAGPVDVDALTDVALRMQLVDPEKISSNPSRQRELMRYLHELLTSSEESVQQQPAQQQAAAAALRHQISELCTKNTDIFVHAQTSFDKMPGVLACADQCLASLAETHMPRLSKAAAAFATEAQQAMATRHIVMQVKEARKDGMLDILRVSSHVRRHVSQGQYEPALQLLRHYVRVVPLTASPVAKLLREDLFDAVEYMERVLVQGLCDGPIQLPHTRHMASLLCRTVRIAQQTYRDTHVDLRASDVCLHMLRASMRRVKASLSLTQGVLAAIETWRETMLSTCRAALSLFVDDPVEGSATDPACGLLLGSFVTHATDLLYDCLSSYLYTTTHCLSGPPSRWASVAEHLDAVHTKVCDASMSLAGVGAALELELLPYKGDPSSPLSAWDHAALDLWTAALAAIDWGRHEAPPAPSKGAVAHAAPAAVFSFPTLVQGAVQLVTALNTLRCFAPRRIQTRAVHALAEHLAQHVPAPGDARTCFVHELAPWAASALVQGVLDGQDGAAALGACPVWAPFTHKTRDPG